VPSRNRPLGPRRSQNTRQNVSHAAKSEAAPVERVAEALRSPILLWSTMDEHDVELLVRQIQLTNQAWHTHQALFGAQTPEARALRAAKNHLQRSLLSTCGTMVEPVVDGETDDGAPTYLLEVQLSNRRLHACHVPVQMVNGFFAQASDDNMSNSRHLRAYSSITADGLHEPPIGQDGEVHE
jgi:hypothetical protein